MTIQQFPTDCFNALNEASLKRKNNDEKETPGKEVEMVVLIIPIVVTVGILYWLANL